MLGTYEKTRAAILIADGFEEIEAVTAADILRRAEIPTELVSITGKAEATGSHGIKIICDSVFEEARKTLEEAEVIILPGGGIGTNNLKSHKELGEALKWFNEKGRLIAAICAAPTVLGIHGILKGKMAVCYPGYEDELLGAKIAPGGVAVSGNVITAKAAGSSKAFALKIVEILENKSGLDGEKVAAKIEGQMYY